MNNEQHGKVINSDRISDYVNWLVFETNIEHSYHNHKEMMAWVATALYMPTVIGLATIFRQQVNGYIASTIVFGVAVSVAAVLIIRLFINMQFYKRWDSANVVEGIMKASVMLLNGEVSLTKENCNAIGREGAFWPKFVYDEIECCSRKKERKLQTALRLLFTCKWSKLDNRWKTELASYSMIILSTILAIGLVAWPYNITEGATLFQIHPSSYLLK